MSLEASSGDLKENYTAISERVKRAQNSSPFGQEVTLVAASKTQPAEAIEVLYHLGHRDFGENYVQELTEKAQILAERGCSGIRWHFIGGLQSNKVKQLLPYAFSIHSVDSEKLAREISKQASKLGLKEDVRVFISVNLHGEASKSGVPPGEAAQLASKISELPGLNVLGLMSIPSPEEDARSAFQQLRELEKQAHPFTAGYLSMGMTQDFEEAIAQGSTHVRVGTALFGQRKPRNE